MSDPGLSNWMRIPGAQLVRGALPAPSGGPEVLAFNVADYAIAPGAVEQPVFGTLAESATAVAIGLDGDRGFWTLPAGVPDTETPSLPSFSGALSFAATLPLGTARLVASAVDGHGHYGPPSVRELSVAPAPSPRGQLVITLRWSTLADLDLHVVEPNGTEVWANHPVGAGVLDVDSNARCTPDGIDREHVVYAAEPPPGHYLVRVDATSLCGVPPTAWTVEARHDGTVIAEATGTAGDADTIGPHERGAGTTALAFDLP